jgi:hypothetical protein
MVAPPGDTVGPIQFFVEDEVEPSGDVRQEHVTPEPPKKRSRVDAPRKPARKRVACPSRWKVSQAKRALDSGMAHISPYTGTERPERKLRAGCGEKCNRCQIRLTLEQRISIHKSFYELENHQRQLDYIFSRIQCITPKKKYAAPGNQGCEKIRIYHLKLNGKDIRVCKTMFMDTLSICDSWIKTATNNSRTDPEFVPEDRRGKHGNRPSKYHDEEKNSIRNHINLIPRIESHYTRERSKREYIEQGLTVEELYRRYVEWCKPQNFDRVPSLSMYRKIFNEEFNIGLFKPKKDQCVTCSKWKRACTAEKVKMARMYAIHRENNITGQRLKSADKAEAQLPENCEKLCVASYDLQKILSCPKSELATMFYKSKLSVYNFTIFDMGPKLGTCHLWDETQAKKSSSEVASSVYNFMQKQHQKGITEFRFYSDNPTSQNKNRNVFAMYLLASVKLQVKVTHRFLEVGHTHMEVDSMHATIEKATDRREIFDTEEWCDHILNAKKNAPNSKDPAAKYAIEKVGETYLILDFKPLVKSQNWEVDTNKQKIKWTKVREVSMDPSRPSCVLIKYYYKKDPITLNVSEKRGRPVNLKTYQPPSAYNSLFPLPPNKARDLRSLMRDGSIPTKYHPWYENLLSIGNSVHEEVTEETNEECPEDCLCCEEVEVDNDSDVGDVNAN